YTRAITQNPDNILARSYMGQGFVEQGLVDQAIAQWREIKARGGEGSWAEASLREAIRTGLTYSY
ncbi:MAG: cytochrome c-type biogenesis protein CcmH/NrfG, partial [Paracoccaceae bacterium]